MNKESRLLNLDDVNRTGDKELQELIERCKKLAINEQQIIRRDRDLHRAVNISPSCGAEMAEHMGVAKDVLRAYLKRFGRE